MIPKINNHSFSVIIVLFLFGISNFTFSQKILEGLNKKEGFFNFYSSEDNNKIYLEINNLNEEFLYVNYLASGLGSNDIGLDRNQIGNTRLVKFIKSGSKLFLIHINTDYRALSDNKPEVKSVKDAFANSILHGFKIEHKMNNRYIIDITDFVVRDSHNVTGRLKGRKQGSYKIDKSRSGIYLENTKNFPKNTEWEAIITLSGSNAGREVRSVTPTPQFISLRVHHSFVELPDNKYKPRVYDPRSGFFELSYFDYATPIEKNIEKKFIVRHRLEKKNKNQELSEAVEPIIYYLDSGAPEPVKSALLEGASWWNQAFEAAGFKNAFQVKVLPDDADPLDVRYNVINWVHRSTRGWSYGSSVVDPRTGEIIKGHVLLGSLRVRQDFLIAEGLLGPYDGNSNDISDAMKMALDRIKQLSAHEVGHTLGLSHNYASSAKNRASVMDYPHPLIDIENGKLNLNNAYDMKIGDWDKISITYGYKELSNDNESEKLKDILKKGFEEGLYFLSDKDARHVGGAHPDAHLWDNGKNASDELDRLMEVRRIALSNFGNKNLRPDTPYSELEEVLTPIYFLPRYQIEAAVKLIGGLNYRYAIKNDGQLITSIVDAQTQKSAIESLLKVISPKELTLSERIIKMIPPKAHSYSRNRELIKINTGLSFDPISMAETLANMTISLILNEARMNRLNEQSARNKTIEGCDLLLDNLINSTWKSKKLNGLEGEVKEVAESVLIDQMFKIISSKESSSKVKAIFYSKLVGLKSWIENQMNAKPQSYQYAFSLMKIESFIEKLDVFKKDFKSVNKPPDGSPIGSTEKIIRCDFN